MFSPDKTPRPDSSDATGRRTAFVTGGTGCIGAHLIAELLRRKVRVIALVRGAEPAERLRAALAQATGEPLPDALRLAVIFGDVRRPNLGAEVAQLSELDGSVNEVWHCAASFRSRGDGSDDLVATNIGGTQEMLRCASQWNRRRPVAFFYVSTAFAAPRIDGRGVEQLPEEGADSRNAYERSKQQAERLVAAAGREHGMRVNIFRPAIVLGDSRSGQAARYTAYYDMLRALVAVAELRRRETTPGADLDLGLRIRARADLRLNLVPVDFVVAAMSQLASRGPGDDGIFHLVHDIPVKIGDLFDCACRMLGVSGVELVDEVSFRVRPATRLERRFERMTQFETQYVQGEAVFDQTRFRSTLPARELPAPRIDRTYLERINRVFLAAMTKPEVADARRENALEMAPESDGGRS